MIRLIYQYKDARLLISLELASNISASSRLFDQLRIRKRTILASAMLWVSHSCQACVTKSSMRTATISATIKMSAAVLVQIEKK